MRGTMGRGIGRLVLMMRRYKIPNILNTCNNASQDVKNRSNVPIILRYVAGEEAAPLPAAPTYVRIAPLSTPVA